MDLRPRAAGELIVKSLQIIQGWAYQVVERAAKKLVAEDDLIEFKSAWIEPHKAARRIAAQANAARGEDCLWLIGIDESKADPFVEVEAKDPDAWLREVESFFVNKHHPAWRCFQVAYDGKSVYAIAFDTSDFPFLISLKKLNQKSTILRESLKRSSLGVPQPEWDPPHANKS